MLALIRYYASWLAYALGLLVTLSLLCALAFFIAWALVWACHGVGFAMRYLPWPPEMTVKEPR